ncbi:MAG: hypothetical protein J6C55_00300 [Oscillospiraceae bacterium]|nr:hypothetical protein [Oscillospiraceae bacterium]
MIKNKYINKTNQDKIFFNIIKNIFFVSLILIFIFFIFRSPDIIYKGVSEGFNICINIIVPSLFPFMVICNFICLSPIVNLISRFLSPITKYIFRLPSNVGCLIFMSFIGGYPMGAKLISEFLSQKQISRETANRLLCFCVNAGPAFVITAIGYMIYNNKKTGVYLLISHILGSIIIGFILGCFNNKNSNKNKYNKIISLSYSQAFVKSVVDSIYSIINISSFVIIFSVIILVIKNIFRFNNIINILLSFLEITVGLNDIVKLDNSLSLLLASFLISFSGISIICQVFYFIKDHDLDKKKIFIFRIFHGLISVIIIYFIIYFNQDIIYTNIILDNNKIQVFNISPFISFVIFLLSLSFIIFSYSEIISLKRVFFRF